MQALHENEHGRAPRSIVMGLAIAKTDNTTRSQERTDDSAAVQMEVNKSTSSDLIPEQQQSIRSSDIQPHSSQSGDNVDPAHADTILNTETKLSGGANITQHSEKTLSELSTLDPAQPETGEQLSACAPPITNDIVTTDDSKLNKDVLQSSSSDDTEEETTCAVCSVPLLVRSPNGRPICAECDDVLAIARQHRKLMAEAIQTESTSVQSVSNLPLSDDDPRTLIRNLTSSTDAGGVKKGHSISTVNVPSVFKLGIDITDKGQSNEVSSITQPCSRSPSIPDVHVPSHAQTCGHSHQPFTFSRTKASNPNSPKSRRKSSKPKRNKMSKPRALRANDIVTGEPEQYSHPNGIFSHSDDSLPVGTICSANSSHPSVHDMFTEDFFIPCTACGNKVDYSSTDPWCTKCMKKRCGICGIKMERDIDPDTVSHSCMSASTLLTYVQLHAKKPICDNNNEQTLKCKTTESSWSGPYRYRFDTHTQDALDAEYPCVTGYGGDATSPQYIRECRVIDLKRCIQIHVPQDPI